MESSNHSSQESPNKCKPNDTTTTTNKFLVSNCLIVLPLSFPPTLFRPHPFNKPPNNIHFQSLLKNATSQFLDNLHTSFASTTHGYLKLFHAFASHNPFFKKLFSLSSNFHNFCQIHRRSYRSLNSFSNHNFAAILPGDSVAGIVAANGILNFLNIYNTLLVVRLVLTWFPNSPPAIVSPLSTLCDPYLNIFRGIIPPLGGTLDLSPILAFLVLNAFTSAATALPAELPSSPPVLAPQEISPLSHHLTTTQKKWVKRFTVGRSKKPRNEN